MDRLIFYCPCLFMVYSSHALLRKNNKIWRKRVDTFANSHSWIKSVIGFFRYFKRVVPIKNPNLFQSHEQECYCSYSYHHWLVSIIKFELHLSCFSSSVFEKDQRYPPAHLIRLLMWYTGTEMSDDLFIFSVFSQSKMHRRCTRASCLACTSNT